MKLQQIVKPTSDVKLNDIKIIRSYRLNTGSTLNPEWSEWAVDISAPISNAVGVANIIAQFNEASAEAKYFNAQYRLQVGTIEPGGKVAELDGDAVLLSA